MTRARSGVCRLVLLALVLALMLPGQTIHAQEQPLVQMVFNERNGLPTGEANDVLQDADGYIWAGSYGGLIRYDGHEFRNFSAEGLLPSSSVRTLYADRAGRLWVGTNDAGVFVLEDGQITRPQGQPEDSFLCVRGFAEGADGTVYACSNSGVCQIRDGVMEVYTDPKVAGHKVYSLGVDALGRVWGAGDSFGGCVVLQEGAVLGTVSSEDYFDGGESIYSVAADTQGDIWLGGSENRLVRLTPAGEGLSPAGFTTAGYTLEKTSVVNNMRALPDGTVSVSGLHGYAMVSAQAGVLREISESEGAYDLNNSYIDYQGNIWLASTSQGLVKYSPGYFEAYAPETFGEITLNAVAVSGAKGYAGSNGGLHISGAVTDGDRALMAMLDGVRVRDVVADGRGDIWVASYSDHPVVRYTPSSGQIATFSTANGLCGDHARVLAPLSDGSMAVGTQSGFSIIEGDAVRESYTELDYPTILSLLELPDGTLLAGSDGGGIYQLKDGRVTSLSFSEGLREGVVLRMLRDTEGEGCFISAGSSLYYMENGRFERLDALKKEAGSIFDLYLQDGTLWLLQNCGLLEVDRADLLSGGDGGSVVYSFDHGLTGSLNANTRHCLAGGQLYLSTRDGVSVFAFQKPQSILPKAIINAVTVDGVTYEHPERLEIRSDARRVSVDYAVLSYNSDPSRYHAVYELEGFDHGQNVAAQGQNQISYTNLPGGEYVFRLRVSTPDDSQSAEYTFTLVKEKQLTERPIFWVGLVAALIAATACIAWVVYAMKLRSIRRRQQEYRSITEQSLLTFAGAIDAKDKYTKDHSTRVAQYSRELARRMGMTQEEQENIYYIALLHDVGKIGIPDQVLNKPGKLTDEEFHLIQTHPAIGGDILKNFTALEGIAEGARYHHERYDGKGYCEGKSGEDIPLMARIIAVADAYDAMSSDRCYRKGLPREVIEEELKKGAGAQFDPQIVPHMLAIIEAQAANKAQKDG